jgi:hypothetical protein
MGSWRDRGVSEIYEARVMEAGGKEEGGMEARRKYGKREEWRQEEIYVVGGMYGGQEENRK